MRILYLHQFFTTRDGAGGTRSYEHARHLVSCGHEVVMVTAGGAAAGGSAGPRRRVVDGIDVREVRGASADYATATARGYAARSATAVAPAAKPAKPAMRGP